MTPSRLKTIPDLIAGRQGAFLPGEHRMPTAPRRGLGARAIRSAGARFSPSEIIGITEPTQPRPTAPVGDSESDPAQHSTADAPKSEAPLL